MIKFNFVPCVMIFLISMHSLTVMASSTATSIGVKMTITHANCVVNNGKGVSGTYNLPVINDSGTVVDRIGYTDIPLIIDCTRGGGLRALGVSFNASSYGFQDVYNGLLNTSIADIALRTHWKRNGERVIDFSGVTDLLAIKDAEIHPGVYDSSLKVYPVASKPGGMSLTPGRYQADLTVNISYY
ncbi:type 1 fimbrial protein [Salmonella enterica]|nr:type 1 fimbrial protein [Salmonella enterica]